MQFAPPIAPLAHLPHLATSVLMGIISTLPLVSPAHRYVNCAQMTLFAKAASQAIISMLELHAPFVIQFALVVHLWLLAMVVLLDTIY